MPIDGIWNGVAWGSYNGALTIAVRSEKNQVAGELALGEPGFGQTRAKFTGEVLDDGRLALNLHSFVSSIAPEQAELPGRGRLVGRYDAGMDFIEGTWHTDRRTAGNVALIRTVTQIRDVRAQVLPPTAQPNQIVPPLHNRTDTLGSYRLDREDLIGLAAVVSGSTKVLIPAINVTSEGRGFIHVGIDSVLNDAMLPDVIYDVFFSANEQVSQLGHKLVALTFKKNGPNTLFVSDYDRTWVEGKSAEVITFLRSRESKAARILSKYGQIINSIIFLALLAVLPSIRDFKHRFYVVAATFALLFTLMYSWRLAVSFKGYLREKKLPWYNRYENVWLTLASIMLTGLITYLIAKYVSR